MNLVDLLHADQQPALARTPQHKTILTITLIIVLLTVASASIWVATARHPGEGSREATFARAMAAHHAQAVEMALIIRDRSTDTELRQFALDIILTQQGQIGRMEGWLTVWGLSLGGPVVTEHSSMPGMASQKDVNALRTLPLPEMEIAFLRLMIRHHAGGVQMAQDVLQRSNRHEVTLLARAIVSAQQNEISYMQSLLLARDATAAQPAPTMPAMEHSERQAQP